MVLTKGHPCGQEDGSSGIFVSCRAKGFRCRSRDFIENGGPQKKAMHAFANKVVSPAMRQLAFT